MHHFLRERWKLALSLGAGIALIVWVLSLADGGASQVRAVVLGSDIDVREAAVTAEELEGEASASPVYQLAGEAVQVDEHGPYEASAALVSIADGATAAEVSEALGHMDGVVAHEVTNDELALGIVKVELAEGVSVDDVSASLAAVDEVVSAVQPNYVYTLAETGGSTGMVGAVRESVSLEAAPSSSQGGTHPLLTADAITLNDPYAPNQWALSSVNAYAAWASAKGDDLVDPVTHLDNRVTVAVLDNYFATNNLHKDLAPNVVVTHDVTGLGNVIDSDGFAGSIHHGTHVAGIVAAAANNGEGVAGVSHNARLMLIRVFGATGLTNSLALASAYEYLVKNADTYNVRVVNLSLGGPVLVPKVSTGPTAADKQDAAVLDWIKTAEQKGIVTVGAAGNIDAIQSIENPENYEPVSLPFDFFPGDDASVVSVINLEQSGDLPSRAPSSNYNLNDEQDKNISAPGQEIYSTYLNNKYGYLSGTSMAAPLVSGIMALEFTAYQKEAEAIASRDGVEPTSLGATKARELLYRNTQRQGKLARVMENSSGRPREVAWYEAEYGSFHSNYGYGEVDAQAVVEAARKQAQADALMARNDLPNMANKLVESIDAIPWLLLISTNDGAAIEAAWAQYEELSEAAANVGVAMGELVSDDKVNMLVLARTRYKKLADAEARVDKLCDVYPPSKITLDNLEGASEAYEQVRGYCDSKEFGLKSQMTKASRDKLAAVGSRVECMHRVLASDEYAAWSAAMAGVDAQDLTLAGRPAVQEARTRYNALCNVLGLSDDERASLQLSGLYGRLSSAEVAVANLLIGELPEIGDTVDWLGDELQAAYKEANSVWWGLDDAQKNDPSLETTRLEYTRRMIAEAQQAGASADELAAGLADVPEEISALFVSTSYPDGAEDLEGGSAYAAYLESYRQEAAEIVSGRAFTELRAGVEAARAAYEALTPTQQASFSHGASLAAAERAVQRAQPPAARLIAGIELLGKLETTDLTLSFERLVVGLCHAYDGSCTGAELAYNLNDAQRAAMSEQERATLDALSKISFQELKQAADDVAGRIDALPEASAVTARDHGDAVAAIRASYDALHADQRAVVGDARVKRLGAAEQAVAACGAATKAIAELASLPVDLSENLLDASLLIETAKLAFNELSNVQQESIENAGLLSSVIERYERISEEERQNVRTLSTQEMADEAMQEATTLTTSSDGSLSSQDIDEVTITRYESLVQHAREAYGTLDATGRGRVIMSAVNALSDYLERVRQLRETAADAKADQLAVRSLTDLIDAVPEVVTLGDAKMVERISAMADTLSERQLSAVPPAELRRLAAASESLVAQEEAAAESRQQLDDARALIADLPDELVLADEAAIRDARAAIDALDETQRASVSVDELERLAAAERRIAELRDERVELSRQRVAQAQRLIAALPVVYNVTLADQQAIVVAREGFELLAADERAEVANAARLVAAEARLVQLVERMIDELPEADAVRVDDSARITAARSAYDGLPTGLRGRVTNLGRLTSVETRHVELVELPDELELSYRVSSEADAWLTWDGEAGLRRDDASAGPIDALAVRIADSPVSGSVRYRCYAGGDSWQDWSQDGVPTESAASLQAFELSLTGELAELYDVWYRSRVELIGWMGWTSNGAPSGTHELGLELEDVDIRLVRKGGEAPGTSFDSYR